MRPGDQYISEAMAKVLSMMDDGWQLSQGMALGTGYSLQDGGAGKGGAVVGVSASTAHALWVRGMVRPDHGFTYPTKTYHLTERGRDWLAGEFQLTRFDRLPKWAQQEIERLHADARHREDEMLSAVDGGAGSDVWYGHYGDELPLPAGSPVKFGGDPARRHRGAYHVKLCDDGGLEVSYSNGVMAVVASDGNVIKVHRVGFDFAGNSWPPTSAATDKEE